MVSIALLVCSIAIAEEGISMTTLRNLIGVIPVLQTKTMNNSVASLVTLRSYIEGFIVDYDLSFINPTIALRDSFPGDARRGTAIRLGISARDDTGLEYGSLFPPLSLSDDNKWFFVSTFTPGIRRQASILYVRLYNFIYEVHEANGRAHQRVPFEGIEFEFSIDLLRLVVAPQ